MYKEIDASDLITTDEDLGFLKACFKRNIKLFNIFKGSRDGYTLDAFHRKLDGCSNYLVIAKSHKNRVFGAFNSKTFKKGIKEN